MNPNKTQLQENHNNGVGRLNKIAYRDGYLHGQVDEHNIQRENQRENRIIAENNSAASGLLMGITLSVIAFFIGGAIFFFTHANQPTNNNVETAPVPQTNQPQNP